jgi:hypothetical protein
MTKKSVGAMFVLLMVTSFMLLSPITLKAQEQKACKQQTGKQKYWLLADLKLPDAIEKKLYTQKLEQKKLKELKNLEWNLTEGKLPGDLTVAKNGILIGTPVLEKNEAKTYKFKVTVTEKKSENETVCYSFDATLKVVPDPAKKKVDFGATERLRAVGGYQYSESSSAKGETNGFFDLYLSTVMPGLKGFNKRSAKLEMKPWRLWINLRLTSVPQQNEKNIGALGPEYFSDLSKLKFNEIASAAEFMFGLDITLWRTDKIVNNGHVTLGLLFAAGAITNIKPTSDEVKTFKISDEVKERYPDENYDNIEYVAFVPQDVNRFYRQYYAGFRVKVYTHENGNDKGKTTFPAMFDATWGLNDAVSGRKGDFFRKPVFRFDLFFPFKIIDIPMYFFGTLIVNADKESIDMPLFLEPTTEEDEVKPWSPNLLKIAVPENDRDYYRIGLGIDLSALLKKKNGKDKK